MKHILATRKFKRMEAFARFKNETKKGYNVAFVKNLEKKNNGVM